MDTNQEILTRIAEALERISPNIVEKIDLSKYPKGIYILEVNSSGYKEQKKLIIQ